MAKLGKLWSCYQLKAKKKKKIYNLVWEKQNKTKKQQQQISPEKCSDVLRADLCSPQPLWKLKRVVAVHPLYSKGTVLQQSFCAEKQPLGNSECGFSARLLWSSQSLSAEVGKGTTVTEQKGLLSEKALMH